MSTLRGRIEQAVAGTVHVASEAAATVDAVMDVIGPDPAAGLMVTPDGQTVVDASGADVAWRGGDSVDDLRAEALDYDKESRAHARVAAALRLLADHAEAAEATPGAATTQIQVRHIDGGVCVYYSGTELFRTQSSEKARLLVAAWIAAAAALEAVEEKRKAAEATPTVDEDATEDDFAVFRERAAEARAIHAVVYPSQEWESAPCWAVDACERAAAAARAARTGNGAA